MTPSLAPTTARTNRWATATVLALLLILAAQILHSIHGQSLTWDEDDHIFAGYETWKTHDYGLNPEHPPMVKMLATLPLLPLHLDVPPLQGRYFKTEAYMDGQQLPSITAPPTAATSPPKPSSSAPASPPSSSPSPPRCSSSSPRARCSTSAPA